MGVRLTRFAAAVLVVCIPVAGCASRTQASAADGRSSSAPSRLPNPIQITARYTAQQLGLKNPRDLAIGPDGNMYITEGGGRISVVSPEGKVIRRWGKPGSAPGEFKFIGNDPTDPVFLTARIAVSPDGSVFVSDSGNYRVQVFSKHGRFLRQFGTFGSGKGQFLRPFDLVVDAAGYAYVIDDGRTNGQLTKFSPTGQVVWQLSSGDDPDLVGHLAMATIDAHGRLVIGNDDVGRVVYLSKDGHKVDAFGNLGPSIGCAVTVDTQGRTYVISCLTGGTEVFDRAHHLIAASPRSSNLACPDDSSKPCTGTHDPLLTAPLFESSGEAFALSWDGTILKLHVTLPSR
jgi:streptogramin lyase